MTFEMLLLRLENWHLVRFHIRADENLFCFQNGSNKFILGDGSPLRPNDYTCSAHELLYLLFVCYYEHKRLMPHLLSELMSPRESSLCIEPESELSEGQEDSDGSNS